MMNLTDDRPILWNQVVRSKSGGESHVVTKFGASARYAGGFNCTNCKGFDIRGKCSHLAIADAQQAREDAAYAAFKQHEPALSDPEFDSARALLDIEDEGIYSLMSSLYQPASLGTSEEHARHAREQRAAAACDARVFEAALIDNGPMDFDAPRDFEGAERPCRIPLELTPAYVELFG
jgi:hypothetical protein